MAARRVRGKKAEELPSLRPLYTATFLRQFGNAAAMAPFVLRFREFAAASGMDAAETSAALGTLVAARSLAEFVSTPALAAWSDRVGRRRVLCVSCGAACVEFTILAVSRSLPLLYFAHAAAGVLTGGIAVEGCCIADAAPAGAARAVAFGRLLTVVGATFTVGPLLGGELAARYGGAAPFVAALLLNLLGLVYMLTRLRDSRRPETLAAAAAEPPRGSQGGVGAPAAVIMQLLKRSRPLRHYLSAGLLSSIAMSAFSSVNALWCRETFGWESREMGHFVALMGLTLMVVQSVVLPRLLQSMEGREARLAQLCLLTTGVKLTLYGLAPSGRWIFAIHLMGATGSCSMPVLQSLCSRCAPEAQQGALAGCASALNTAATIVGALLGSRAFAMSLQGTAPAGSHLFLSSFCMVLAASFVWLGSRAESRRKDAENFTDDVPNQLHGA